MLFFSVERVNISVKYFCSATIDYACANQIITLVGLGIFLFFLYKWKALTRNSQNYLTYSSLLLMDPYVYGKIHNPGS